MKITTRDLIAVLRLFDVASESDIPRMIDQVSETHPAPINQLVSLRFKMKRFYVLLDETANDSEGYIREQIQTIKSDLAGSLLSNPISNIDTFGMPYKGKTVYLFAAISAKIRLDSLLASTYPDVSRSTWQKRIKAGYVSVNREVISSPKHEASDTDTIAISLPPKADFSGESLPIIYLDDHVIVIDKPIGILTHSKGAMNDEFTVADFVRRYTKVGLESSRPGIVHRLDRDTSGIMIAARTPEGYDTLKSQFSDRKAKKQYRAIVSGYLEPKTALIDVPIGRNPSQPSTFRADPSGKSAQTLYEVTSENDAASLVRLYPKTGRTHQLRVHMSHIGHPIIGDRVYGKSDERLYLHAHTLEITLPSGERRMFTSPVPDAFARYMELH